MLLAKIKCLFLYGLLQTYSLAKQIVMIGTHHTVSQFLCFLKSYVRLGGINQLWSHKMLDVMSMCLYSCLSCLACTVHLFCAVLYCHLWLIWLFCVFPLYLINSTVFLKKLLNITCVFSFTVHLLSETFLILTRMEPDVIINFHRFSWKVPVALVRF